MDNIECAFFHERGLIYKETIGEGGFGKLFLVYSQQYGQFFALKKIPQYSFNEGEIECLKHICHANIINLYKYFKFNGFVYMLMEYCPKDLYHTIKESNVISDELLKKYIYEILLAINACHNKNIAHQDIKPSNFLLDKYGRIKVCDFGLSQCYHGEENPSSNSCKGTFFFMAPEMFKKCPYNPLKADIWSLGVTLFYLATKTFPFVAPNKSEFIKNIFTGLFPSYKVNNALLREVIQACLVLDPMNRASVDQLLEMPYFDSLKYENDVRNVPQTKSLHAFLIKPICQGVGLKKTERKSVIQVNRPIPVGIRKRQ